MFFSTILSVLIIHTERLVAASEKLLDSEKQSICDLKHWIKGRYVKNVFKPQYLSHEPLSLSKSSRVLKSQELQYFSKAESRECLRNRKIWFVGDSYIRCFFNGFMDVLRENYRTPHAVRKEHIEKEVTNIQFIPKQLSFVRRAYMEDYNITITNVGRFEFSLGENIDAVKQLFLNIKDDDLIVFNLLIHDNKKTWVEKQFKGNLHSAETAYLKNVKNIVEWLKNQNPKGKFVWTTSNSYNEMKVSARYRKYQANKRILRISSNARNIWIQANFPVLDSFHLTGVACRSCTFDGGHFNSMTNWAISQLLLNFFCRPRSCNS